MPQYSPRETPDDSTLGRNMNRVGSHSARENVFREDINALRALAVIAVVGFHLHLPGFDGGFTGVDSFLVITGYLMGLKVVRSLGANRFSLVAFWTARMRRIYPALAVVVILTIVVGWFLMLPVQFFKHLLQSLSALAFVSNFAFSFDSGYFSAPAQTKALLHTWSLSVEWQFYFWMPIIAMLTWRRWQSVNALFGVFLSAAALSLAWCLWESHTNATAQPFFSLRTRAWEPLVGGIIAITEVKYRPEWTRHSFAYAGWLLLLTCTIASMPENGWPSEYTILPVIGATLVIVSRNEFPLLRNVFVQRIGDWSYSIYLWHWPIWVLVLGWCELHGTEVSHETKAMVIVSSLAMGAASYSFIEQPFRANSAFWTTAPLLKLSMAISTVLTVLTIAGYRDNGFPWRFPDYIQAAEAARRIDTPRGECFRNKNSTKPSAEPYCSFGDLDQRPSLVLWGDSFANQFLEPLSVSATTHHLHGLIATQSACRVYLEHPPSPCANFIQETLQFILSPHGPSIVVIDSSWGRGDDAAVVVDRLLDAGKTVILIKPLLNIGFDLPRRWIENQVRRGGPIPNWNVEATPSLLSSNTRIAMEKYIVAKHAADPHFITIDPQTKICANGSCTLVKDGHANFRDTAHIASETAMQYLPLFDEALDKLSLQRVSPPQFQRVMPSLP
ncbi:acyltransferase family protein [Nitrobacter sp.]|uniref:acyltransferase family protein n=1 Tax=Nitrobacter sp. TaxID=29420 RepID=UPI0029CAC049|nr:acyltransferase family protein [Nitrobacter sp.]